MGTSWAFEEINTHKITVTPVLSDIDGNLAYFFPSMFHTVWKWTTKSKDEKQPWCIL